MNDEARELKKRISELPDEQLLEMVEAEAGNYRREALEYARAELKARAIDPGAAREESAPATSAGTEEPAPPPSLDPRSSGCLLCGGRTRTGTLVAEKEMTIVFSDNREERFIRVNACTQCGQVVLVADYDTDVQA
jgi:hypothetical protein